MPEVDRDQQRLVRGWAERDVLLVAGPRSSGVLYGLLVRYFSLQGEEFRLKKHLRGLNSVMSPAHRALLARIEAFGRVRLSPLLNRVDTAYKGAEIDIFMALWDLWYLGLIDIPIERPPSLLATKVSSAGYGDVILQITELGRQVSRHDAVDYKTVELG